MSDVVSGKGLAISMSLYGGGTKYAVGAIRNVALARRYYPGADVVVQVERGHFAINGLLAAGAKVVTCEPEPRHLPMLWRLRTVEMGYDAVLFRDADSRIGPREVAAVGEWLRSGAACHAMRDHPSHRSPLMGGMWGMLAGAFDVAAALADWQASGSYGDDESFLAAKVWPAIKGDCIFHSSRTQDRGSMFRRFPVESPDPGDHVGRVVLPGPADLEGVSVVYLSPAPHGDRRERMLAALASHAPSLAGLNPEWFVGTPRESSFAPPSFRVVRRRAHWWPATCDHLRIMELSLAAGHPFMVILEDDAIAKPDFEDRFWRAWCALPGGWRAMRLGWHHYGEAPELVPGVLHRADTVSGLMAANLWSRDGLYRAYDHFWHRRKMIVDVMFRDLRAREPDGWYQPSSPVFAKDPRARQKGKDYRP